MISGGVGRWLLLLALAAGLIGMHHLEAGSPERHAMSGVAMVSAAGSGHGSGLAGAVHPGADRSHVVVTAAGSGPAMEMAMHLCLAVLAALLLGVALLAVAVLDRRAVAPPPRAVVLTAGRPPPRSAVRLALLCVLRN